MQRLPDARRRARPRAGRTWPPSPMRPRSKRALAPAFTAPADRRLAARQLAAFLAASRQARRPPVQRCRDPPRRRTRRARSTPRPDSSSSPRGCARRGKLRPGAARPRRSRCRVLTASESGAGEARVHGPHARPSSAGWCCAGRPSTSPGSPPWSGVAADRRGRGDVLLLSAALLLTALGFAALLSRADPAPRHAAVRALRRGGAARTGGRRGLLAGGLPPDVAAASPLPAARGRVRSVARCCSSSAAARARAPPRSTSAPCSRSRRSGCCWRSSWPATSRARGSCCGRCTTRRCCRRRRRRGCGCRGLATFCPCSAGWAWRWSSSSCRRISGRR